METTINKTEIEILKEIQAGKYRDCYLVYIRKSTDEPNNQKNSISYQKTEGVKFAAREKLSLAPLTLKGFCADGLIAEKHSGFKEDNDLTVTKDGRVQYQIDRPKFQKLVQFLSLGLFKGIVCLCWDRVSRNRGDDTILRKLMRKGVDVRFVYANYDKTSAGALHMDIDGMFAEHHSRVTSEKVRLATSNLRQRGIVTYKAPVGYLNLGSMENKPFDPQRAPIIKKLFELCATGEWSLSDLVRFANEHGLTMPPVRRRRTKEEMLAEDTDEKIEIPKVSRPIIFTHLHFMLRNPFYTGRMLGDDGTHIRSTSHQALVSDGLFNMVQAALTKRNTSTHYEALLDLPFRGVVRCGECGRIYTPYIQKGIQYFSARCIRSCPNTKKSFNLSFLTNEVGNLMAGLSLTDDELSQMDAATGTNISLLEEKRLKKIEQMGQRKNKIRDDLTYLRTNKLQLLKTGVYTPEALLHEETALSSELAALQDREITSDVSMRSVIEDVTKLSELLKAGSKAYSLAEPEDKELIMRVIFSELSISGNTLKYKCKNGFQALEKRFSSVCAQTTWFSELLPLAASIRFSVEELRSLIMSRSI